MIPTATVALPATLRDRVARLAGVLVELDSVLVAFSGGADSALVLAAAVRTLGPQRVAAATGVSGALPAREQEDAGSFAASVGVRWYQPGTDELRREGYRRNDGDRCFHCKSELMSVLGPLAESHGLAYVVTGTNADDLVAGFRPGIRAAREAGARAPLAEAGLSKADVRAVSAAWGLRTWDKPAAACLSSRIAFGLPITPTALARVERAEQAVREVLASTGASVVDLRVRDLGGDHARVELDALTRSTVTGLPGVAAAVCDGVRGHGFTMVELAPFRSGGMNDVLPDPERFR